MDDVKTLTVFINASIYNERLEFYKELIENKFFNKNYSNVFILGINQNLSIRLLDFFALNISDKIYRDSPYRLGDLFCLTPEAQNFSFEKHYVGFLKHLNISVFDFCNDYILFDTINTYEFFNKDTYKEFTINEIPIYSLLI